MQVNSVGADADMGLHSLSAKTGPKANPNRKGIKAQKADYGKRAHIKE